jgi:hypothetical protein
VKEWGSVGYRESLFSATETELHFRADAQTESYVQKPDGSYRSREDPTTVLKRAGLGFAAETPGLDRRYDAEGKLIALAGDEGRRLLLTYDAKDENRRLGICGSGPATPRGRLGRHRRAFVVIEGEV